MISIIAWTVVGAGVYGVISLFVAFLFNEVGVKDVRVALVYGALWPLTWIVLIILGIAKVVSR